MPPDPAGDYYLRGLAQVAVPANETPEPAPEPIKRGLRPHMIKALRDTTTATFERRMRKELEPYIFRQYKVAADAVRSGA